MTREEQMKRRGYLSIFASYYKPHWKLFALDMVCALVICVIDLVFPYVSRYSMQQLLPESAYRAFFVVMAIMAAAYVLKGGMYFIVTYWGHLLGVNIEADIRSDLFGHMQKLSFSFGYLAFNKENLASGHRPGKAGHNAGRPGGQPALCADLFPAQIV